nr:MAG TPA: Speriolin N terminus [Caudoviricetes sp.]
MDKNKLQPVHYIMQELTEKTLELANYKVAYEELYSENAELRKLEELINTNTDLKELVEEIKNKQEVI